MDPTTLFYTFSTVAQTLAAGFAVLSAFVLYRLQGMENELLKANYTISGYHAYMSAKQIWELLIGDGYEALETRMKAIETEKNVSFFSQTTMKQAADAILFWWPLWRTTVTWLKVALVTTVADIAVCFSLLSVAASIARSQLLSYSLMAFTILVGVAALVMYARLIYLLVTPARLSPFPY